MGATMLAIIYGVNWLLVLAFAVFIRRFRTLLALSLVFVLLGLLNAYYEEVANPLRNILLGEPWQSPEDWLHLWRRSLMWWLGCVMIMLPLYGVKRLFLRRKRGASADVVS